MKIKDFEFNMRELGGSMGDFGTLFPLAVGYIVFCGMNPAGFLVMMGLTNIATGLIYHLPMPLEPMKALAVAAIAQRWPPSMIYASAFGSGLLWLFLGLTGLIDRLSSFTPRPVTRGIQIALGLMLATEGLKGMASSWVLSSVAVAVVLLFRKNKYAPASVILMGLGVALALAMLAAEAMGSRAVGVPGFTLSLTLPPVTAFSLRELWRSMALAGFAQVPLTLTNAVIAASSLISHYFPDKPVPEKRLAINMGVMNVICPFFGGMPMCHGAGGLAGQYFFGARTGGTNIIEGAIEMSMGLFFAGFICSILSAFPKAIIGTMMFLVGIEMAKFVFELHGKDLATAFLTVLVSFWSNMALGYVAGIAVHQIIRSDNLPTRGRPLA